MFRKILAAIAVTAGLLLAAPVAANAVGYTDGAQCSLDASVVKAGETARLVCIPGTWSPGEEIHWTIRGLNGANFRMAGSGASSAVDPGTSSIILTTHANADGSDLLEFTVPERASGAYSIIGVGQTSGHECPASLTVLPADQVSTALDPGGSSSGLADTGSVVATWAAWMGGSLVVLGLISLAIVAWLRRAKTSV